MGKKKRSHGEAWSEPEQHFHHKQPKKSHGTPVLENKETSDGIAGSKTLPGEDFSAANGILLQREAKEWLLSMLTLLNGLTERPDLLAKCKTIVGDDLMQAAFAMQQALSAKRGAIKPLDCGLHSLKRPPPGKTPGVRYNILPPLPSIKDPKLAEQAFRHKSALTEAQIMTGDRSLDYERLEFLGDSYINLICVRFLCERYPSYSEGQLASLKDILVCNDTLGQFSLYYGFDERLKIDPGHILNRGVKGNGPPNSTKLPKLLGDVFEAYLGALIESRPTDGVLVAEEWLQVLWTHRLPGEEELEIRKSAKNELSVKVMSKGIKLTYQDIKPSSALEFGRDLFTVGVYLTGWGLKGVLLGEGSGLNKKDAGQRAADKALVNPTTTQVSFIKRKFDALWKEENDREGGPRQHVLDQLEAEWKYN